MRRVDLTPALRKVTPAELHAGSRRLLALLDGLAPDVLAIEISVLKERAQVVTLTEQHTDPPKRDWPVMEGFGALLFLVNQGRDPEKRSLVPGTGELGFVIGLNSGLLPPGIVSLRCICGLYPPPDMFAVLQILRDGDTEPGQIAGFAGEAS